MLWLVIILFALIVLSLFIFMIVTFVEDATKERNPVKTTLTCIILVLLILNGFVWGVLSLSGHLKDFGVNRSEMAKEIFWGELGALASTIICLVGIRFLRAFKNYRLRRKEKETIKKQSHDKTTD